MEFDEPVGEIWFEPPPEMPDLLVKYLFTSEPLSVQVHPSDRQAPPGHRGKEECWLVPAAEPGASITVGFKSAVPSEAVRAAALDGTIADLLEWHKVTKGDFIYLPPGTVHAIGPGLVLLEIQQNSDVTYRMFDFGRPRELHLDQAISVADLVPHDPSFRRTLAGRGDRTSFRGPRFNVHRVDRLSGADVRERYAAEPMLIVPLTSRPRVGADEIAPFGCAYVSSLGDVEVIAEGDTVLVQPPDAPPGEPTAGAGQLDSAALFAATGQSPSGAAAPGRAAHGHITHARVRPGGRAFAGVPDANLPICPPRGAGVSAGRLRPWAPARRRRKSRSARGRRWTRPAAFS